jgi:dephospho-CoA kinase
MKIFIIVGMPASGKNIARAYAEAENIPYFATGDWVRKEVERRGLASTADNTGRVSTELRGEDGLGVTRLVLEKARRCGAPAVFLEGMRSWPEIQMIREGAEGTVVAFVAPREIRLARVGARGRADDSPDRFAERDLREIGYGTAVPIALADEYILNTESPEGAAAALDRIVKRRLEDHGETKERMASK